ncbi:RICIN domain-containing protein [Streptomyces sp. NPDC058486]|uniref:RICIN domain-containing protein n=1 Tax=Streptomyces sp. NPDC058486 TaxID=3346526 RepID=UPI0036495A38
MPVPTEELKLEIIDATTGRTLGARAAPPEAPAAKTPAKGAPAKAAPAKDDPLVVRDYPVGGPPAQRWRLVPVPTAPGGHEEEDHTYVIHDAAERKVLDNPAAADRGVCRADPADGKKSQQWHVVPVDGEPGRYFIESVVDGTVLDLGDRGPDATPVVLREHDPNVPGQRWRLVPAAPERDSDVVLRWTPLRHWNGRTSWRLTPSTALRPSPAATPSFSNVLMVLGRFGADSSAGGWKDEGAAPVFGPVPGSVNRWAGPGARILADAGGTKRHDIVALKPAKGVVTSACRGDGTFEDEERLLHPSAPTAAPADLWTLADLTGDGRPDLVVLAADGVRVSRQNEDETFAPAAAPALKSFGHGAQAGTWLADRHPRFLVDTTGDGRLDIVGCHDDGVHISLQAEDGTFDDPLYVLDEFGVDHGWASVTEHPRFAVAGESGAAVDIVGFGPQGVVVSHRRGDGTFEPAKLVLNDFGSAQGWTGTKHLRFLTDVTGDGRLDIVGFGDEGVWVSHRLDGSRFERAQLVCRGFGYDEEAGAWRVDRHPRFLADVTGDGRLDIVGFGGPGVYVARNLFRRFRTR